MGRVGEAGLRGKQGRTEAGGAGHFCSWERASQPSVQASWLSLSLASFLLVAYGNILFSLMARSPEPREELGSYGHSAPSLTGLSG